MQNEKKTDWSFVEKKAEKQQEADKNALTEATNKKMEMAVSQNPEGVEVPQLTVPDGILSQFRANTIKRKAALDALHTHYDSQLDVLGHTLSRAAQAEKSRVDVSASQYMKELDSKYLEVLAELGMRNKDTREKALIKLSDQTAEKLREVRQKDWPQNIMDAVIDDLMALHKRYIEEIFEELGGDYMNDQN